MNEDQKQKNDLKSSKAVITAKVIIRDKDGNVKYDGNLDMDVIKDERAEDGSDS
jgi:hypothetical protein